MQKTPALILSILLATTAIAQKNIKQFVTENAVQIRAISPDSTDFSDLKTIGEAIGDAKIVMLGEQDHGDAPTFLAKTRLIQFLHEKMGFTVLAFESDFFGLNQGFDRLEKNRDSITNFIRQNIFPIWTGCNTCEQLFYQYIPATYQTENPLVLSGFDNQMILGYSTKHLATYLDSLFQSLHLPITDLPNYKSEILPAIDSLRYGYGGMPANYADLEPYLIQIKNQVAGKLADNSFDIQVINSLLAEYREFKLSKADWRSSSHARDSQMAANLQWLSEVKFPKEKIIVWAANAHVARYHDSSRKGTITAMGSFLTSDEKLMKNTYIIGFTSYEGNAGRLGSAIYPVRKPKSNGFENWIDKSYDYAFVDFRSYLAKKPARSEPFYLKALGHFTAFERDWTRVFDGVFFIRDMYPCKR